MGAGKSTVGARVAHELGWGFVDLDEEIVRVEQKSIAEIFETAGEASFRELEHLALADALQQSTIVLALGGGAVETAANRKMLASDAESLLIYLQASLEVSIARCERQTAVDGKIPRRPVLERQAELAGRFQRRKPFYESAHWIVETAERSPDETVRTILDRLKERSMDRPR